MKRKKYDIKAKGRNCSKLLYILLPRAKILQYDLELIGSLIVCFRRNMGADYFLSLNVGSSKTLADKARSVFHR